MISGMSLEGQRIEIYETSLTEYGEGENGDSFTVIRLLCI